MDYTISFRTKKGNHCLGGAFIVFMLYNKIRVTEIEMFRKGLSGSPGKEIHKRRITKLFSVGVIGLGMGKGHAKGVQRIADKIKVEAHK